MKKYNEKDKNDLVFKVLKSMNPFMTDSKQKKKIQQQINNIFEEDKKRVTFQITQQSQQFSEDAENQNDFGIKSKVYDLKIISEGSPFKKQTNHARLPEASQLKRHMKLGKSIAQVQKKTYETFNIKPNYQSVQISKYDKRPQWEEKKYLESRKDMIRTTSSKTLRTYRHQSEGKHSSNTLRSHNHNHYRLCDEKSTVSRYDEEDCAPKRSHSVSNLSLGIQSKISNPQLKQAQRSLWKRTNSKKDSKLYSQNLQRQSHNLDVAILQSMLNSKLHRNRSGIC